MLHLKILSKISNYSIITSESV